MYFKNKLVFIFLLNFLFLPVICNAKIIEINNDRYNVDTVIEEDCFKYNPIKDTLTLTNATLSTIKTAENLKIILKGDNYLITDDGVSDGIKAKKIEIEGDGTLIIESKNRGIVGEKITINGTNLKIISFGNSLVTSSSSNYDLIVNNSNLELESDKDLIKCIQGNIYFNNSNIKVNKANNFIADFTNNVYINNTKLEILEIQTIRYDQTPFYINGMSYLKVKAINNVFLNSNYILNNNLKVLSSQDDISYNEADKSKKDIYIKIYNEISEESLKEKEKELFEKQELLINQEKDILKKLENLNEKEKVLNEQENNLILELDNLNYLKKEFGEKQKMLDEYETNLLSEKEKLNQLVKELENEKILIENQKKNINEDLLILNEFEKSLKIKESELLKKEDDLNALETTFNCNSENVDFIENPKTYNGFINSFIVLVGAFVSIVLLVIKKRGINE